MKPKLTLVSQLPVTILLVDAFVRAGGSALLLELLANRTMKLLFEDGLGLDGLELGLEVFELVGRGVAAAACIVHVVGHVFDLVAVSAPGIVLVLIIRAGDLEILLGVIPSKN